MKFLNGLELQGFIKERQARQVRNLRQQHGIAPKLVIIKSKNAGQVINTYVRMKTKYAADILIDVDVQECDQSDMSAAISTANADTTVQGIIVQLPVDDPTQTDELCNQILPVKDVDGLGEHSSYPSATAEAIDWLLTGYNIELAGKHIALLGRGKLVGAPLERMWAQRSLHVAAIDKSTKNTNEILLASDVIVTATGVPRIVNTSNVKPGAVVVDAGTASENGVVVGDVDAAIYESGMDITITPQKGGVGPLTYTVLFDHVIQAALMIAGQLPPVAKSPGN